MKYKDIWTLNSYDDYLDKKLGLVYKDIQKNAFEIILCSTEYEHISEEDIVIPVEESDLKYSIVAHSDMIFPLLKKDKKLDKKIGTVSDLAIEQIGLLRNDIERTAKTKIQFSIGAPIFYKSDKRYFMKLKNLEFVSYFSEESYKKILFDIPDNVTSYIVYKSEKGMFESIREQRGVEGAELVSKQLLALIDRGFKLDNYLHQVEDEDGDSINLGFNMRQLEKDLKKVSVAA